MKQYFTLMKAYFEDQVFAFLWCLLESYKRRILPKGENRCLSMTLKQ